LTEKRELTEEESNHFSFNNTDVYLGKERAILEKILLYEIDVAYGIR